MAKQEPPPAMYLQEACPKHSQPSGSRVMQTKSSARAAGHSHAKKQRQCQQLGLNLKRLHLHHNGHQAMRSTLPE